MSDPTAARQQLTHRLAQLREHLAHLRTLEQRHAHDAKRVRKLERERKAAEVDAIKVEPLLTETEPAVRRAITEKENAYGHRNR